MQGSSNPAAFSDSSGRLMRTVAADLGEVIAYLAGGLHPDPETMSRLLLTLRQLQDFLNIAAERFDLHQRMIGADLPREVA